MSSSYRMDHWRICLLIVFCSMSGVTHADKEPASRPSISLMPDKTEHVHRKGEAFIITCKSPHGIMTTWSDPKGKQIASSKGRIHVENPQKDSHQLMFKSVMEEDEGTYQCSSQVDGRKETVSLKLIVTIPISFNNTKTLQYAELYHDMTVRCEVTGNPQPTITWQLNNKNLNDSGKYKQEKNGLLVRNVTLDDDGTYQCRAYQMSGSLSEIKDLNIVVDVQHKPIWQLDGNSTEVYGYPGGVTNLTCQAIAKPKAKFEWLKDNKTINNDTNIVIFDEDHMSTLQVTLNNASLFGDYICNATNTKGIFVRLLILKEGNRPKPPTEISDITVTSESIQMKVSAPQEGQLEVTGFHIEYTPAPSKDVTWENYKSEDFALGEICTLNELEQDTQYAFRVQTRNAAGLSVYSDVHFISTEKSRADSVTEHSTASILPAGILAPVLSAMSARHLL